MARRAPRSPQAGLPAPACAHPLPAQHRLSLPQVYWWHDKYRPRRPKYFNRVHTGCAACAAWPAAGSAGWLAGRRLLPQDCWLWAAGWLAGLDVSAFRPTAGILAPLAPPPSQLRVEQVQPDALRRRQPAAQDRHGAAARPRAAQGRPGAAWAGAGAAAPSAPSKRVDRSAAHHDLHSPFTVHPPSPRQGYKFNIFYPELIDRSVAPTYKVERDPSSPDGERLHRRPAIRVVLWASRVGQVGRPRARWSVTPARPTVRGACFIGCLVCCESEGRAGWRKTPPRPAARACVCADLLRPSEGRAGWRQTPPRSTARACVCAGFVAAKRGARAPPLSAKHSCERRPGRLDACPPCIAGCRPKLGDPPARLPVRPQPPPACCASARGRRTRTSPSASSTRSGARGAA